MIIFYLNDIRKSFYMLSLYFSVEKQESRKELLLVYSDKNSKFSLEYLDNLESAFFNLNFISISNFLINKSNRVDLFFYDLDYYSKSDIDRISKINIGKKILLLNNNIGTPAQEISSLDLSPDKYLVWNHEFISHLINLKKSIIKLNSDKILLCRDHLAKVSLINHKQIEVLFFLPTRLSFKNEIEIGLFLDDLSQYLKKNKRDVYFKPHQRSIDNYLIPKSITISILSGFFSLLPSNIISLFSKSVKSNDVIKILNYAKFNSIQRKNNFKYLKFPLIPIEFYLNFIEYEIIGGFSNTLIISSYFGVHSKLFGSKTISNNILKRGKIVESSKYLFANMNFFKENNNYVFNEKAYSNSGRLKYVKSINMINELIDD